MMVDTALLKAALRSRNGYDADIELLRECRRIRADVPWAERNSEQLRIVKEADKLARQIIDEAEAAFAAQILTTEKAKDND